MRVLTEVGKWSTFFVMASERNKDVRKAGTNGVGTGTGRRGMGSLKGSRKVPQLLRDMRWVYKRKEEEDKTEGHRACREVQKENPAKFLDQLSKLEQLYRERVDKSQAERDKAGGALQDERTDRLISLVDQFLTENGVTEKT
jgi:hypothetical protein